MTEFTRRDALVSSAALTAGLAVPGLSVTQARQKSQPELPWFRIMELIGNYAADAGSYPITPLFGMTHTRWGEIELWTKLIQAYPGHFQQVLIESGEELGGVRWVPTTRALKFEYTVAESQELCSRLGILEAKNVLTKRIVDGWMEEVADYEGKYERRMLFHRPIQIVHAVRPDTFAPVIGFKFSYAAVLPDVWDRIVKAVGV